MSKMLVDVQLAIADRINTLRCVQRIVTSEEFQAIFAASLDNERVLVVSYIENADRKALESWVKNQSLKQLEYENLSVRELRAIAQQVGISNSSQLPKYSLVIQIKARTSHARTTIENRTTSRIDERTYG